MLEYGARPLGKREEATVRRLLSRDFAGVEELRDQVARTCVAGPWVSGSAYIQLAVADQVVRSPFADGPTPGEAWAYDASWEPAGTLLLWVDNGYLSALEYGWVTADVPAELPPVERLRWHDR